MSTFIKLITNKWVQLGSFIVNTLFLWNAVYQYSSLVETDANYMLKKQILLFCILVFGLFVIAQIITFFLLRKQGRKTVLEASENKKN